MNLSLTLFRNKFAKATTNDNMEKPFFIWFNENNV